jgi:hypothetical protein
MRCTSANEIRAEVLTLLDFTQGVGVGRFNADKRLLEASLGAQVEQRQIAVAGDVDRQLGIEGDRLRLRLVPVAHGQHRLGRALAVGGEVVV